MVKQNAEPSYGVFEMVYYIIWIQLLCFMSHDLMCHVNSDVMYSRNHSKSNYDLIFQLSKLQAEC